MLESCLGHPMISNGGRETPYCKIAFDLLASLFEVSIYSCDRTRLSALRQALGDDGGDSSGGHHTGDGQ